MKLKAPKGVGDPCVAGAAIASRDGVYDVDAEVGALLMGCFGFVAIEEAAPQEAAATTTQLYWPVYVHVPKSDPGPGLATRCR